VPNRNFLLSFFILFVMWGVAAYWEALVPHTVEIDPARLEQQGLSLAQEAAQLAQFQQYEIRARLATGSQKFPVMVPVGACITNE